MNIKQIFIFFCLFIVFISALSFVSAADDVSDSIVSIPIDNTQIAQATDTQDSVLAADSGSFTQLDDEIQNTPVNKSIKLHNNYTYSSGERVGTDGIVINKDITIDGDGHAIDGDNLASIFQITDNANVVLKNIVFANARGTNGSAVILSSSENVKIINSQFINNSALLNGGAIYVASADTSSITSSLNIVGSTFVNNRALNGGAIYVSGDLFNVTSSTFNHNIAINDGGSIYSDSGGHIEGNVFEYETAGNDGGTMYLNSKLDSSSVDPSVLNKLGLFNNIMSYCSAGRDGGAGFFNATHGTIRNTTFSSSTAKRNGGGAVWLCTNSSILSTTVFNNTAGNNGGGIYLYPPELSSMYDAAIIIMYTDFANNTAYNNGGALYCGGLFAVILNSTFAYDKAYDGAGIYLDVAAAINYCTFNMENANHDGGAIYLYASNTNISSSNPYYDRLVQYAGVRHSLITNCIAGHDGGAGYVYGNNGIVQNLTMINNTAGHDGGAGYVVGNYGRLFDSIFINNTAGNDGGALLWEGVNGTINNISVVNNKATNNGGGISLDAASSDGTISIANATFASNEASYGGAVYCADMFSNILDSNFAHDKADYGGAIYLDYGAYIHNSTLFNESAAYDGGGIYLNSSNTDLDPVILRQLMLENKVGVIDSVITNCSAGRDGGAGYVYGNYGVVDNLTMINNFAGNDGGAGYVFGNYGKLTNSHFINNTAGHDGGALLWEGVNGTIDYVTVIDNKASYNGGGISLDAASSKGTISIANATFASNEASYGGAVYCADMFTNILDSSFAHDKADYGGAIYLDYGAYIHNSTLFNESAAYDGGGIYLNSSNTDLDPVILRQLMLENKVGVIDSVITNCSAGRDGGAGYVYGNYGVVDNLTMINNFAGRDGGAGYVYGNYGHLYNSTMINNRAGDDGGALFWFGNGGTVENITCRINKAEDKGGSIYISGSDLSFTDSCFALSNATNYGGAIYITGNNVIINDSIFEKCSANIEHGGAIYAAGTNTTISNSTFTMNRVNVATEARGGSIYVQGDDTKIIDSDFEKCTAYEGGVVYINGDNAVLDNLSCIFSFASNGGAFYINGNDAVVSNTDVSYNNATDYGGAIYVAGNNTIITFVDFEKCIAYDCDGGAIYVTGFNTTISRSTFAENRVSGFEARGGSINIQGNVTKVLNCIFDKCTAYEGGVIYVNGFNVTIDGYSCNRSLATNGGAIYIMGDYVSISNFNMSYTNATDYGGAIYIAGDYVTIDNSNFTRCISYTKYGGALFVAGSNVNINHSNFIENKVTGSDARGGSIYIQGNNVGLEDCTFIRCSAIEGGTIYVNGSNVRIEESSSAFSLADYGGSIYVAGNNVTICHFDASFNNATSKGGSIYIEGDGANIYNANFMMFGATLKGGAIYVEGDGVSITNATFQLGSARDGGAIYVEGANTMINASSFANIGSNISAVAVNYITYGGAIYVAGDDTKISYSNFTHTNAGRGGAIYVAGKGTEIGHGSFYELNAGNGSAIYVEGHNTNVHDSSFIKNVANYDGGSVYLGGVNASVTSSIFSMINATRGGAIFIDGNNSLIEAIFDKCSAFNNGVPIVDSAGGAIYISGNENEIRNSIFNITRAIGGNGGAIYAGGSNNVINNISTQITISIRNGPGNKGKGGGIYVEGNNVSISDSRFKQFSATDKGGAIYVEGEDFRIEGSRFEMGSSTDGAGIYIEGSNARVTRSNFLSIGANVSDTSINYTTSGGAIYAAGNNTKIIKNYFFQNNAGKGGSIYVSGEGTEIFGSKFIRVNAGYGAAVYVEGNDTTIDTSLFNKNIADFDGGSVYLGGLNAHIINSSFSMVNASRGGAVFISGNLSFIDGSNFTYCFANSNRPDFSAGGAIFVHGDDSTISKSSFVFSMAKDSGGSICVEGSNSKIDGNKFENCSTTGIYGGGAIFVIGFNSTISNSNFTRNRVNVTSSAHGGAIDIHGNDAKVLGCNFDFCIAYDGGAVDVTGANVVIDNSLFMHCSALNSGGAVDVEGANATISNSQMTLNNATGYGGAIYVSGSNALINNTAFTMCLAENKHGGAIYVAGLNTTISYSNFTKNSANGTGAHGGAIDVSGNDTKIYKCIFDSCSAYDGGTLYIYGEGTVIDGMNFKRSIAIHDGGIIYILGNDVTISNTNFSYSNASHNGGAVYVAGNNSNIVNSSFTVCIAKNGGDGGAIYIAGLNATVEASRFNITQSAQGKGGAIFIAGDNATVVDSTLIRANSTSGGFMYIEGNNVRVLNSSMMFSSSNIVPNATGLGRGGAIFIAGDNAVISADFKFTNATGGNGFDGDGGALYVEGNNANITGSSFFVTIAKNGGDGGAIYIAGLNATVEASKFDTSQSALGRGGAIYINGYNANVLNSTFIRANSTAGGFIYIEGARADVLDSTFMFSSSNIIKNGIGDGNGGAIYIAGDDAVVSGDFRFINATGGEGIPGHGGAIYVAGNNANITDSTFFGTHARNDGFGGAIYVTGNNTYMNNDTFDNGFAYKAGAVYISGNNAVINMSDFVSNNCMDDGGAVYITGENVKVINSNFTSNIAGDDGGAIYWEGNGGLMENITCFDNHAISSTGSSNGGTICIIGSNINLNASTFEQTHALIAGGAIFITGNYVNITDSSFKNCFVSMDIEDTGKEYANGGGSIYVLGNYTNLLNCIFEDTHAREGGAIYIQGNEVTIDELNSTYTYAKAGGSIYIAGENAKLLNSNLTYSHANDGGAIYVRGDNTLIDSNLFAYNNVSLSADSLGSGGAIYVRGASTNITHSIFLYSTAYGGDGGSVYIGGYNTNIEYSEFQHSRANEGEGGSIFVAGNLAHVHDSLFNDTQAGDGGAIYIGGFRTGEDAKILNCTITNSQSKDDGGAIYVAGANALISVDISNSKSLGLKDTTGYGGAIYVGGDDANITQSSFNNCSAGNDASGGAIYVEGDYANIEKSKFHNTYANDGELASGGAIAIEGNRAIVSESEFTECFASNGGVLFVQGRRAELRDSNITDCYAYGYGGAIYILDGEKTLIDGSLFDNCTSINKEGGAIVINGDFTIISNSNFTNCNASSTEGLGGAIYIEGEETTIQNAIFTECISVDGGAIYIQGNDVHISDSAFIANKLKDYADDDNYGGAIYINGERTIISTSTFEDHSAYTGGSIYINGKDTTILDSNITRSTADYGGAIFIQGINAKIEGGNISYCSCAYDGGAIYVNGTNAHISADFAYCNASSANTPHIKGNGGAIYVNGTDTNVYDSNFLNCVAMNDGYGGAIYIEGLNTLVQNSKFENTWTSDNGLGGAIYVEGSNATVKVSEFKNSHAREGGAIYIEGINTTVTDSKFTNTNVGKAGEWVAGQYVSPIAGDGGAIYIYGANTHIENATISSSYATKQGGAIYVEGDNAIVSATIYDSSAGLDDAQGLGFRGEGGAIYVAGHNTLVHDSFIYNTHADNDGDGGAVYVAGVNTVVRDSSFDNSKAYDGGAVYVTGTNTSIISSNFTNMEADHVGGAAYVAGHNTYITGDSFYKSKSKGTGNTDGGGAMYIVGDGTYVSDSNFTLSDSKKYGGAIYIAGKNTNILTSNFIQNHAESPGGAVYIQRGLGLNTTVDRCYFFDNSAGESAGALHVSGTNTTVNNTVFIKNHGVRDGGAIYIDGINATVQYTNLSENSASDHGGAIYWKGGHGGDSIVGCIIFNNSATSYDNALGGGVYWDIGNQVTPGGLVKDTIFDSNYAGKHGGGMDWHRTVNSTMDNCTFINNIAGKDGGGFYCGDTGQFDVSTNLTIINTKFSNNTANYAGGGLSLQMRDSQLINCTFENNIAYFGGSIVIKDTKTTNNQIINCTFINSTASTVLINSNIQSIVDNFNKVEEFCKGKGGAIFARDNNVSVIGCIFINCTGKEGGAVFWDGGDDYQRDNPSQHIGVMGDNGIIRDSTFIGNNATLGGAVCWTSPNGVVTDSTFIGNNATLGGAVYWKGGVEYIAYVWNYKERFAIHGNNGKVVNSEFIENTAINGGAIYWAGENGNVSNSKFTDNYAEKGGAIYWTNITQKATYPPNGATTYTKTATTGNNGIVVNSTFFANKANYETGLGGAIYWNTSSSNITDTTFLNNTASKGGAIYWVNGTKIDNSTFRFNKAHTGSAIYEDASMKEMDIIDSSFLENRADSNKFEHFDVTGTSTGIKVSAYFRGNDNIINAMYNDGGEVYFTNVTYLGVNALAVNTGLQRKTPVKIDTIPSDPDKFYQSDYEVGQIVRISVYDQNGFVAEDIALTGYNGYVERDYSGLTAGDAKVKIEHPADDYYTYLGDRNGAQLVYVFIDTEDIYCLDDEIINITVVPQNKSETRAPTGNITIKVIGNNGKTYEANITLTVVEGTNSSVAQFNATLCPTGIYSVDVFYHGDADNYFFPQDNSSSFRVFEIDPTIVIQTENIWVGQTEVINITVDPTKKVTGTVSVYIDSVYIGDLPLVNGTIQIRNSTLPVGVHNVIGIYNGDEHFKLVRNTSTFVVSKYDPYFVIEGRTIFVDNQEYLEIFISNKTESGLVHIPTGFVYLVVDGQQYYINLTTQKGILLPISTEAGIYHVWGNYSGDGFWNSAVNTTDFLVLKHNITLNVTDAIKVYGGEEKINVTFEYDDVTGNVTIRIMDKTQTLLEFKDVPIVKGNATVEVSGLNPGNYTIDVVYLGDRKYYGNTTSGNLTVKKGKIPIIIVPQNIFFGEKENITVYANTTGWVDIYINGTWIGDDYFANGEADSSKGELAPGIYNASAYFRGNDYYEPGWVSAPFEVYKLNRTVDLSVEDIIYGMYENLRVFVNASGNVTIWVNGTNKTIVLDVVQWGLIDKGSAKWVLKKLDVGTYPVEVWYNGNEFYNPAYTWGVFQVIPVNTTLTVDVHDIYVWDNESLKVTVRNATGSVITDAPGNITISIDGVTYSEKINNGVARFVIPNLTIGTKNVWAFYDGDKNHNGNRSIASFKVMPRVPVVNVTAQNITVGKVENLHVEIPANATGFVIITGNFTENGIYVSKFVGGKADISVHDLASGNYSVHIKYYGGGDDNYTIAEADTVFKVSGEDTPIHIDVKDIYYRQTANITVSVNDGVTGLITIKVVNGSGIIREITLPISKGKVNLLVDNLAVDNYTVYADYLGNNKYHANSTSKVFKVKKIAPQITIDSVDTNSIRNATVVVHITPGTTGNVTITVNNKKYNGTIENGVVKIVIDQLNSGNYTVHAYYAGDRNFTEASATKVNSVNIFRYSCYLMNVTAEDTKVDLNTTIIVNLPYDATGFVNITVNETLYPNVKVERGVAKLNVTKSIYGKYIVKATFMDGKYANKTVTTNYHVFKWETPMVITVINETSLHVGDIVTIVVGVPANITDNVTIEIAGNKYSSKVINGNATFKVANLTSGNKTVTAIYAGNYKYMFNATTHSFKIAKRPSTVVVNTTGINVGDVAIINVTVPANATGYVVISVNGTNYTVNVTDGKGSIPVSGLPYGTYNINVTYIGDEQYLPSTNSTTLKVSKVPSFITVAVNNITVGDVAIINMTVPKDATGNITVKVNSTVVVVGIVNGIVQAIIPYLKVGNYTVDVTYNGDGKYLSSTNATKLTVNKVSSEIIVVDYGNGTVVVIVPGNATGNVTIEVEGKNFTGPVINGTAVINLTNVTPGEHNITVIYSGDENHTSEIINATVAINKIISPIKVVVTDIYVGDVAKINVTVPGNATGKIRIEIDGKAYFEPIDDGVARFKVENLTAGVKTVAVSYAGDCNYTANFTTANFTVKKHAPVITVNAADITVGGIVLINVTAPSDVTRPVIVNVNDVDYAVNITKGVGQLSVADLDGGKYNVTVKYLGDDKYLAANNTAEFKVSKVPSTVSAKADNITVGQKAVIEITVPRDATGNVTVRIDNKDYNVSVADGKGTLVVPGLKVGNYTVDVKYLGDRKYESNVNATIFSVNKASSEIIVVNQGNGTVVVIVPGNATGNVTIEVEGKNFTGPVINGTAVINLTNVTPGEHNITVIYSGDENHTSEIINATVAINKIISPIKVVVTDIYVGDVAKINVTVPGNATGKIRIEIDGKAYFEPIDDGVARFKVENLTGGVKTVYVSYDGDNNYAGNHISGNFTVKKHTPSVTVNAGDITVGEIVLINVTAPSDVTRPVIVNVGGVDYAVNITNGIGQLPVSNLDGGSYGVTVKYLGDDKYLDADNATGFKVSKLPSNVSVKADNITVGEKAVIEITVLDDATGIVVVNVNGKDYNVPVADGKGTLVVSGLKVRNYTVNVKYIGDRKYEESTNSCKFAVNKIVTDEIIVVDQGNGTVVVVVPGNATGNVTIEVEGKNFTGPVINGTAIINLTNITSGEHNITVIYSGDENHTSKIINSTVTVLDTVLVPIPSIPISVDVNDIYVGDVARINVTVRGDATGKVRIEIDGKEYFADIENGVAMFEVENLTAGVKTVAVIYLGDENYAANFTTANFTVYKRASTVSGEIESIVVGEYVTVKVKVPIDATGQVLIDIDGVSQYYVNVTGGKGLINIPYIPSGEYNVNLTYIGDAKYLPSTNIALFDVNKIKPFVIPIAHDIYVGELESIRLFVPADATGNVTVIIDGEVFVFDLNKGTLGAYYHDGEKYIVAISGGNGELVIAGLPVGEYVVSVRYNGDYRYTTAENSTVFNVISRHTDMEIIDQGNGTVVVIVPDNATGNVTIVVENKTFVAPVINGTAVIDLINVTPGKHNITAIYSGDETHDSSSKNATVDIPKYYAPISVKAHDIYVGDTEIVVVTVPRDATGIITIEINAKEYSASIKDGQAVFNVDGLAFGNKTVAVKYSGDDKYRDNYTTGQFKVIKRPTTTTATAHDIHVGENETIVANVLPGDATGIVLVNMGGVGYYAAIVNGTADIIIPELPNGVYIANVYYNGDGKYLPSNTTVKFTVSKLKAPIDAAGDEIKEGNDATVVVRVPKDATGTVTITVDGKTYTEKVKDGKAVFVIPGLVKGDWNVDASYSGDKKYEANDTITDILVYRPDIRDNSTENNTDNEPASQVRDGINLSDYPTGNPILIIFLILIALGVSRVRRFKK